MRITEFLKEESVVPVLVGPGKEGVLRELSVALNKSLPAVPVERLFAVLTEREKAASTAMEKGVAIPHGRLPEISTLVACFGVSHGGINFDARDGRPSNFFFALVAPENSAGVHLKALAKISRLFRSDELREAILASSSASEIYALIAAEDGRT
jgi:PTS system nitrogen regulatory IIA component